MRLQGIELLRGLSAFGIVGCHLSLSPQTESASIVTNLCDLNVGVFAALAGYLMSQSRQCPWWDYVQKRARRLLPVYFVWTAVFLIASAVFQYLGSGAVKPRYADASWWMSVILRGGASAHLWFLISLFYAQALLWRLLPNVKKTIWIGLSLVIVLCSIPFHNWCVTYPIRLLAFMLLGYGLSCFSFEWLGRRRCVLIALAAAVVAFHFVRLPIAVGFLKDWVAAGPILLLAASASLPLTAGRISAVLGATSMGVYLVHPLFTRGFSVMTGHLFQTPYGVFPVLLVWGASWACAFAVTICAMRNSSLRKWFS